MTVRLDPARIDAHVAALHEEIAALRTQVEEVADLSREAALDELLGRLAPALGALGRAVAAGRGGQGGEAPGELAEALSAAIEGLGVRQVLRPGELLELWPEQASAQLDLDRAVPEEATLVRVEVVAPGYSRAGLSIVRPRGRVIEVIQ